MNAVLVGGGLGLLAGGGALLAVRAAPPMRPIRLQDRVAPYLGDNAGPSRLLARPSAVSTPFLVVRRLFGPAVSDLVSYLDRVIGGAASVRRRLAGLSRDTTVEEFRFEQIVWAAIGLLGGSVLTLALTRLRGQVNVVLIGVGAIVGLIVAVLASDWQLSQQLRKRENEMMAEFPVIADLLALAVIAGEAPTDALSRVCRSATGHLTHDLAGALAHARTGVPITTALSDLAETTTVEPFSRFIQGLVVAIERGTPLVDVLRAQALDARESRKRVLLEAGGRKEISMMVTSVRLSPFK